MMPVFKLQGCDITARNVNRSDSIYGSTFTDENFVKKQSCLEILSMGNVGKGPWDLSSSSAPSHNRVVEPQTHRIQALPTAANSR
ncbi:unnamed protein product [Linum tenue]|nr:unnamed protein product [Linum tenue]